MWDKEGRSQGLRERSSQGREVGSLSQSKLCLLSCPRHPITHRHPHFLLQNHNYNQPAYPAASSGQYSAKNPAKVRTAIALLPC